MAGIENELAAGEKILWQGSPQQGLFLRSYDSVIIPFGLVWGCFALSWEYGVITLHAPWFFVVGGLPFVVVGLYMIFGHILLDAWRRAHIAYVLTNSRVIIRAGIISKATASIDLRELSDLTVTDYPNGRATLIFAQYSAGRWLAEMHSWPGLQSRMPPVLDRIDDGRRVFALIRQAQIF